MPENIFGINVGQVETPRGGGIGGSLQSAGGTSLNSLIRFQQKMYEMEQQRKAQELENKNALFGGLAKKMGLGAQDDENFYGFSPMNKYQATMGAQKKQQIAEQFKALAESDGSSKNYAQTVANIRKIYDSPEMHEAILTNKVVSGALQGIKDSKANVHPIYQDELGRFQNAETSGDYNINVLRNWKDYTVEPIDHEEDLKNFKDRGISISSIVSPDSGQELLVTSQDNKPYIDKYYRGKYSKNFGLDYDRAVKNGDPSVDGISKDEYVESQVKRLSDSFAIQEDAQKINNIGMGSDEFNRRKTYETDEKLREAAAKSEIEVKETQQKETIKTEQDLIREQQKNFAPQDARSEASSRGSKGSASVKPKNPFSGSTQTGQALAWDNLQNDGVISSENSLQIKDYVNSKLGGNKLKALEGKEREDVINGVVKEAKYKYADKISDAIVNKFRESKGAPLEGKDLTVRILHSDNEISLSEHLEKEIAGKKSIFDNIGYRGRGMPNKPKNIKVKSRFIPEGEFSNSEYSGSLYTTNPDLVGGGDGELGSKKVTGLEANKAIGDKVFDDNAEVYKVPSVVNRKDVGMFVPTSFKTVTVSNSKSIAGERNNPGNVKDKSGKFKVFSSLEEGFDAMVKEIDYKKTGEGKIKEMKAKIGTSKEPVTVADLIETWSPRFKNGGEKDNTDAVVDNYIKFVSDFLGVKPNTPLKDIDSREIAVAMALNESPEVGEEMIDIIERNQTGSDGAKAADTNKKGYLKSKKGLAPFGG